MPVGWHRLRKQLLLFEGRPGQAINKQRDTKLLSFCWRDIIRSMGKKAKMFFLLFIASFEYFMQMCF